METKILMAREDAVDELQRIYSSTFTMKIQFFEEL